MEASTTRLILTTLVVAAVLGGCATGSPSPSDGASGTPASSAGASAAAPGAMSTVAPVSTPDPASATLALGGSWLRPEAGATLKAYKTTLVAEPWASGEGGTTVTKVVFWGKWSGAAKQRLCAAMKPGTDGTWSCTANLLALGVPPGRVKLTFDVHGVGVATAVSPDGARAVKYAVAPPRPTKARWAETGSRRGATRWEVIHTYRVRWSAPAGYADEFLVYNTWECPRDAKENDGKPCFVPGTPVDASALELLATVGGDARSAKVRITEYTDGCNPGGYYGTILVRARNATGSSAFAIVESADFYWIGPYDTVC